MRQQGTVQVRFTIDRRGRLLDHQIVKGSGHAELDAEVSAMLERASPMPAIPESLGRSQVTITVPIVFALR
ncbi:MAG: energy transducer TonB [Sphingobacteriia bacterium]|nr:energy transducer TonB [Sphingobacteriia bacterium]NCC40975.1 energy transducer TonB [Gammaproteobacteria bacterium]